MHLIFFRDYIAPPPYLIDTLSEWVTWFINIGAHFLFYLNIKCILGCLLFFDFFLSSLNYSKCCFLLVVTSDVSPKIEVRECTVTKMACFATSETVVKFSWWLSSKNDTTVNALMTLEESVHLKINEEWDCPDCTTNYIPCMTSICSIQLNAFQGPRWNERRTLFFSCCFLFSTVNLHINLAIRFCNGICFCVCSGAFGVTSIFYMFIV